jgi:hypothetical protein
MNVWVTYIWVKELLFIDDSFSLVEPIGLFIIALLCKD